MTVKPIKTYKHQTLLTGRYLGEPFDNPFVVGAGTVASEASTDAVALDVAYSAPSFEASFHEEEVENCMDD